MWSVTVWGRNSVGLATMRPDSLVLLFPILEWLCCCSPRAATKSRNNGGGITGAPGWTELRTSHATEKTNRRKRRGWLLHPLVWTKWLLKCPIEKRIEITAFTKSVLQLFQPETQSIQHGSVGPSQCGFELCRSLFTEMLSWWVFRWLWSVGF